MVSRVLYIILWAPGYTHLFIYLLFFCPLECFIVLSKLNGNVQWKLLWVNERRRKKKNKWKNIEATTKKRKIVRGLSDSYNTISDPVINISITENSLGEPRTRKVYELFHPFYWMVCHWDGKKIWTIQPTTTTTSTNEKNVIRFCLLIFFVGFF